MSVKAGQSGAKTGKQEGALSAERGQAPSGAVPRCLSRAKNEGGGVQCSGPLGRAGWQVPTVGGHLGADKCRCWSAAVTQGTKQSRGAAASGWVGGPRRGRAFCGCARCKLAGAAAWRAAAAAASFRGRHRRPASSVPALALAAGEDGVDHQPKQLAGGGGEEERVRPAARLVQQIAGKGDAQHAWQRARRVAQACTGGRVGGEGEPGLGTRQAADTPSDTPPGARACARARHN